jgi:hypothetical protein
MLFGMPWNNAQSKQVLVSRTYDTASLRVHDSLHASYQQQACAIEARVATDICIACIPLASLSTGQQFSPICNQYAMA